MSATPDFVRRYGPTALILGGSEGIGRAFAQELAGRGLNLVLVARNPQPLEEAAAQLRGEHRIEVTVVAQVLTAVDMAAFATQLLDAHDVGLIVCNAGATHGVGAFLDAPLGKALGLLQLNCSAPVVFAHQGLSRRRGRGGGLVVVSSMSGLVGSGLIATYAAAKAFEIALCEGLHWELGPQGLDVLCAVAGLTDTPAMRRSGLSFEAAAKAGYVAMQPAAVARGALERLGQGAVWYAVGEQVATTLQQMPRPQLTGIMSEASALMYGNSR